MGRLVIAHHKSYHPYRRDNIEKVRRDEEEAALKEAKEEGRMMLADSEARIDRLRERAGTSRKGKGKAKEDDDMLSLAAASASASTDGPSGPQTLVSSSGHVNLFEDLEQNAITTAVRASRKKEVLEDEKGVRLAPSEKDLNPWYSEQRSSHSHQEPDNLDEKQRRDMARKSAHDPLTSITHQLASRPSSSSSARPRHSTGLSSFSTSEGRIARESSERERALALIRRKKKEMAGSDTPSTVFESEGYEDVYNRRAVEDAHRGRGYGGRSDYRQRGWDDDREISTRRERRSSWGR